MKLWTHVRLLSKNWIMTLYSVLSLPEIDHFYADEKDFAEICLLFTRRNENKEKPGSAIRAGMKQLFTSEECLTMAWSETGIKMSSSRIGTRIAVLDQERLAVLRDLTDKWAAYYKFAGGVSGDKFKGAVRGHLDEVKVQHRERPSPPSPAK